MVVVMHVQVIVMEMEFKMTRKYFYFILSLIHLEQNIIIEYTVYSFIIYYIFYIYYILLYNGLKSLAYNLNILMVFDVLSIWKNKFKTIYIPI